jgi:hypothetical protein
MPRSKPHRGKREPLPDNFESIGDFQEFWDTHSSADYEELMEDVEIEVDIRSSRVYCAVARDILTQLRVQARRQGVSTETLINLWLREKAAEAA